MLWNSEEFYDLGPLSRPISSVANLPLDLHQAPDFVSLRNFDQLGRLKQSGKDFTIPWHTGPDDCVHEVELGVILNGKTASEVNCWRERIGAYVLLLDMGDMAIIKQALTNKYSWTFAKHQDNFLVLSDLISKEKIEDPHNLDLELLINGEIRQKDNTANMIFKIDQ